MLVSMKRCRREGGNSRQMGPTRQTTAEESRCVPADQMSRSSQILTTVPIMLQQVRMEPLPLRRMRHRV